MKIMLTGFILFFSAWATAMPLNKIVVFGDSLSDNGNLYEYMKHQLPISPPYFQGRFTNGPVWIEHIAKFYYPDDAAAHLLDYAFGGSGVSEADDEGDEDEEALFTLRREIDSYLLAHHDRADEQSLFAVWMGSNNYVSLPDDPDQAVIVANQGILHELERLAEKGAKHIMVVTLPDLGQTPAAVDFDSIDVLTSLTHRHNALLEHNVLALKEKYPAVQWLFFDVNVMFMNAIHSPADYGFTNVTDTCYEAAMGTPSSLSIVKMASMVTRKVSQDACEGYLFFDPIHPTVRAHQFMAEEGIKILQEAGIEFVS